MGGQQGKGLRTRILTTDSKQAEPSLAHAAWLATPLADQ
jgi:hypothetical protein